MPGRARCRARGIGSRGGAGWTPQNTVMYLRTRNGSILEDEDSVNTATMLTPCFLQGASSSAYIGGYKDSFERVLDGGSYTIHCKLKRMVDFTAAHLPIITLGSDGLASRRGIYIRHRSNNRMELMVSDGTNLVQAYMTGAASTVNADLVKNQTYNLFVNIIHSTRQITAGVYDLEENLVGTLATVSTAALTLNDDLNFFSFRFNSKHIACDSFKKYNSLKTLTHCNTDNHVDDLQIHIPLVMGGFDIIQNRMWYHVNVTTADRVYSNISTWVHDYGYGLYRNSVEELKYTLPNTTSKELLTIPRGAGVPSRTLRVIKENFGEGLCNLSDGKLRFSNDFFDRSDTDIWNDDCRDSDWYDSENTKDFHIEELNQRTLMSWLNDGYRGRFYVKFTDNSIEKWDRKYITEIFLLEDDLKGADQVKALKYTGDSIALVSGYDVDGYARLGYLRANRPMITMRFDDGYDNQYDTYWPYIQSHGIGSKAVVGIHTRLVGTATTPTSMSWDRLRVLHAEGWDVACHNPDDDNWTGSVDITLVDQIEDLLNEGITDQEAEGLPCLDYIGNRYSMQNPSVPYFVHKAGMRCAMAWGGTVYDGIVPAGANPLNIDLFNLYCINVDIKYETDPADDPYFVDQDLNATQIQNIKDQIDLAVAENRWIIFMNHSPAARVTAMYDEIIPYAQTAGCHFVNVSEAIANIEYQL